MCRVVQWCSVYKEGATLLRAPSPVYVPSQSRPPLYPTPPQPATASLEAATSRSCKHKHHASSSNWTSSIIYCPTRKAKQGHCNHRENNALTREKKVKRRPGEGRDEATEGELGRWPDLVGFLQGCNEWESCRPLSWCNVNPNSVLVTTCMSMIKFMIKLIDEAPFKSSTIWNCNMTKEKENTNQVWIKISR